LVDNNKYEYVVIGSGFGGSIIALTFANKLEEDNKKLSNKSKYGKVCILERGQWWISPEIPIEEKRTKDISPILHQYLRANDIPYNFFPYPDDFTGLISLIKNFSFISDHGLYDYKILKNIGIIRGIGIGGGSLVYFNVTERPDPCVYKEWPTESDSFPSLSD
jgi:choline dehydrogenase-like flavoprotein